MKRLVRPTAFVASTPGFTDQPKVVNGASDLMVDVLGDAGRHARVAVGAPSLPLNVAVEISGIPDRVTSQFRRHRDDAGEIHPHHRFVHDQPAEQNPPRAGSRSARSWRRWHC